jgi:type II secretory pathway pseudopilin PulG
MTHARALKGSNDEGETLIELVMAVAIMGITIVAIVGGIATSILMSDIHRKQATAGAYVRNYAEAVEGYVATTPSPASLDYSKVAFPGSKDEGFDAKLTPVGCWDDSAKTFISYTPGCAVQRLTLSVTSTDERASESLVLVVRQS